MTDGQSERVEDAPLGEALSERYLAYALSTITARSLPDVRDGLKPVHRRLLYAMQQLRLDPTAGFKKCARVVGDVIGKYHPHGDVAVYDAMVRLAQDFAVRYPLVEGQGNFGNIDGDNAAAMRYTEARLTEVAEALLAGIDEDAVDFRATYDGEDHEPIVLPAAFPNLLANGAAGIAVGMATAIPPHNAGEIAAAALSLIRSSEASTSDLLEHLHGPDFPTGGVLVEDPATLVAAYETGRGSFRLRATWRIEHGARGAWWVVVDEIPYQVPKARLIEQIATLLGERKLPLLGDVRDESTDQVRLILEPRSRSVEPKALMETLFHATALENRIALNMNVLADGRTPKVMGLRAVLRAWLDHREVVLGRRSRHRLAAITHRIEVLDGYLVVFLDLDAVIRIVREEDKPREALMQRFSITQVQADAILDMRLRNLRRLEEKVIRTEHRRLTIEQRGLVALLADPAKRWAKIAAEVEDIRTRFGTGPLGQRRTRIEGAPSEVVVATEALIEREALTVILSEKGWIRAVKGTIDEPTELRFKAGDSLKTSVACETTDRLCLFLTDGRAYTLRAADLPRGRGDGQPVRLLAEFGNDADVLALFLPRAGSRWLVAGSGGRGFVVKAEGLFSEKRTGRSVLNLRDGEEALVATEAVGDHVAALGSNGYLLVFPLAEVPELARGSGVALQRYRAGGLVAAAAFPLKDGLSWQWGSRQRHEGDLKKWLGKRGQTGRPAPVGFPKAGGFH